jgi:hypothetical protein
MERGLFNHLFSARTAVLCCFFLCKSNKLIFIIYYFWLRLTLWRYNKVSLKTIEEKQENSCRRCSLLERCEIIACTEAYSLILQAWRCKCISLFINQFIVNMTVYWCYQIAYLPQPVLSLSQGSCCILKSLQLFSIFTPPPSCLAVWNLNWLGLLYFQ